MLADQGGVAVPVTLWQLGRVQQRVRLALVLLQVELVVEGLPSLRAAPAGSRLKACAELTDSGISESQNVL